MIGCDSTGRAVSFRGENKGGSRSQTRSQNGKPAASYSDGLPKTKGVVCPPLCPVSTLRVAADPAQSQIAESPADLDRPRPTSTTADHAARRLVTLDGGSKFGAYPATGGGGHS